MPPVTQSSRSQWLFCVSPKRSGTLRLICYPHAGGDVHAFWNWPQKLPAHIEVWSISLPGKYGRWNEPPLRSYGPVVEAIAAELKLWTDRPYAFFGHSLGALMSFEVARRVQDRLPPLHLFVAGMEAPHRRVIKPPIHDLSEEGLMDELRRYKGTPEEILANPEVMTRILPILRADFSIYDSYRFEAGIVLKCPISAYCGRDDDCVPQKVEAWSDLTDEGFDLTWFEGGHFFVLNKSEAMLRHIGSVLKSNKLSPAR